MTEPVFKTAGIDLDAFAAGNKLAQNLIDDVGVLLISIKLVFVWTVAHDIVDMTIDVKTIESGNVFLDGLKIFQITFLFAVVFPIGRVVRVKPVYDMGGADDKIERVLGQDVRVQTGKVRLQSELNSHAEGKISIIFLARSV